MVDDRARGNDLDPDRPVDADLDDNSADAPAAESDGDDRAPYHVFAHLIGERTCERPRRYEWVDLGESHVAQSVSDVRTAARPYAAAVFGFRKK